jgi:D-alanyl-D-alanine carboxypeptidase/D-alanyl-D-alanine-endopeptidase (penicillin-binding protein 4)
VADARTGSTLYQRNATHFFTPASNAKLFTSALALSTLGPDYRWRTTLETTGQIDSTGTLHGNLVLVGRGDPNLSNRVFPFGDKVEVDGPPEKVLAGLIDDAIAHGLKQVDGDVVADDSYFSYDRYPPGWNIDDLVADYGAPVSAIVLDDNTLEIDVTPGARPGDPVSFQVLPRAGFYRFINRATTAAPGSAGKLELKREPDSRDDAITGQIPVGAPPAQLYLAIEQPARYAAALVKRLLVERGVAVYGQARALHLPPGENATPPPAPDRHVLAEHQSPTLAETVRYLLKVSQNLHAECLLRTVAHEQTGVGSLENGLKLEQKFLQDLGIDKDVAFYDGSGLSRYDLVTPRAIVTLLRWAQRQKWGDVYRDALPIAGHDGTLENRMHDTVAAGRVLAKTGTLFHDHSLSGYVTTLGGRHLIFSILVNNIPPKVKMNPYVDQIAVAMVDDLGGGRRRTRTTRPSRRKH